MTTTLLNTNGPITTVAALNAALVLASQQTSGAYEIDLAPGARIALSSALNAIILQPGVSLSIMGNGATLDGQNALLGSSYNQRGFFVYSGDVTIADLTVANTAAIGGTNLLGGGGGAGLGGGLFVAADTAGGVAPAHVTLDNVNFTGTSAVGGAGGGNGSGGGGGLGNVGSFGTTTQPDPNPFSNGPITVQNPAPSTGASAGYTGIAGAGGGIGGQASTDGKTGGTGGFGGGGGGGGGGISVGGNGGDGGFGGGGGGAGFTLANYGLQGGNGGFGGGGGYSPSSSFTATTRGGFGGGDGFPGASGGGLAAGGDVFVQEGATLVVRGGTLGAGGLSAGTYGGSAYGSALFIQGDTPVALAPDAGETLTIAGSIADQTGSGGTGANAGAGSLNIEGQGTVVLSVANTFSGGIHLDHGTLELKLNASASSGAITFGSTSEIQTLQLDENVSLFAQSFTNYPFATTIANVGLGDVIDLAGFAYRAGTTATYANGTLTVSNGLASQSFTLDAPTTTSFTVERDGGYGTRVISGAAPTITGLPSTAAVNPGDTSYRPFANLQIADSPAGAPTVSVTITLNDVAYRTGGLTDGAGFSGLSARSYDPTTGFSTYTLNGTAANLSAELNALTFSAGAGTFARTNAITFNLEADTSVSTLRQFATTSVNIAPTTVANNVTDAATLSADLQAISRESQTNGGHGTHYEINLAPGATLTETADLSAINLNGSDSLTINGNGATLDGAYIHRGLFANSGTVAVNDLTITHMQATGGAGGNSLTGGAGGGGAGLGGGLFIAAAAQVSLSNVAFAGNAASGGRGGYGDVTSIGGAGGGGGGLGGDGGAGAGLNVIIVDKQTNTISTTSGTTTPATSAPRSLDSDIGPGSTLGDAFHNSAFPDPQGEEYYVGRILYNYQNSGYNLKIVSLDGVTTFSRGATPYKIFADAVIINPDTVSIPVSTVTSPGYYGVGGGGGIGGTASGGTHGAGPGEGIVQSTNANGLVGDGGYAGEYSLGAGGGISPNGVNGGFGGGGAGGDFVLGTSAAPVASRSGGSGGFGGGGGGGSGYSGTGGNGGFGGGGGGNGGVGGFGAGNGGTTSGAPGGGGLGAGGDIFVQKGGSLTIAGGSLSDSHVNAGMSFPGGTAGGAFGSGIFIQGNQTITLAPAAGQTLTISDAIADQPGSLPGYTQDGVGSVLIAGGGVVAFEAAKYYYSGATTVRSGTLLVDGVLGTSAGLTEVQSGATLGGHGTLRGVLVDAGGTFSPGNSPGQISVTSLTLQSGAHYKEEIGGTTAGSGYDQTVVLAGGSVIPGGAILDLSSYQNFKPSLGDVYRIIDNQGASAVFGTFSDAQGHALGEGSVLTVNGAHLAISYHGGDGNDVTLTTVPCYVTGTRILTSRGEIPVEALSVGDLVVTASGEHRPIRWIGHRRVDIARHPEPIRAMPVRITAGAVAPGIPTRDLRVSPDHALALDGVLVKATRLVNGVSILRESVPSVTYWHVELDSHDLLVADGMPAESYIEADNRQAFDGGDVVQAHLDFEAKGDYAGRTCLPLVEGGDTLKAIREGLFGRVAGHFTKFPDIILLADGVAVVPAVTEGDRYRFDIPDGATSLRLVSRSGIASEVQGDSRDHRRFGVLVRTLMIDGLAVNYDVLGEGWLAQAPGRDHRWTDGDAVLPLGRTIAFQTASLQRYLLADTVEAVAA